MKNDKKYKDYNVMIYLGLITRLSIIMLLNIFGFFFGFLWLGGKIGYPFPIAISGLIIGVFCGFYLCYKEISHIDKIGTHDRKEDNNERKK